jgi:hypothetical protein
MAIRKRGVRIYFSAGYDRWSGKIHGLETIWSGGNLVEVVPVTELPSDVVAIRITRAELERLRARRDHYDQPWHQASVEA